MLREFVWARHPNGTGEAPIVFGKESALGCGRDFWASVGESGREVKGKTEMGADVCGFFLGMAAPAVGAP